MKKSFHIDFRYLVLFVAFLSAQAFAGSTGRFSSLPDFTQLVKEVGPAVVNISTTRQKPSSKDISPDSKNYHDFKDRFPLEEFLKKFFRNQSYNTEIPGLKKRNLGSGFIISPDGYIITNHHVVREAVEIIVRLSDRREFEARLVGSDKRSDIALIKIDAKNLPVVKIGDSSTLQVGEWVVAIGSPFGFDHSVTVGVVSAKGRSLPNENYVPFIQTDVAINPGNSGGPLFNLKGEVVGVNSQIFSRTGGYMGLSFAIPIKVAMNVTEQLKTRGKVSRGWLGVYIQNVTRKLAESFGLDRPRGALVSRVLKGGPAAKAGIREGDVIIEFGGTEIDTSSQLPPVVGQFPVGSSAKVKVIRNGKVREITVKIGELQDTSAKQSQKKPEQDFSLIKRLNINVKALSQKQRKKLGISEDAGVLITQVRPGPASDASLREGDIIIKLGQNEIGEIKDLKKAVKQLAGGRTVPLLIYRNGSPLFLPLHIPE